MATTTASSSKVILRPSSGHIAGADTTTKPQHTLNAAFRCPISWPARDAQPLLPETNDLSSFLQARYLECLWLGERFFPLASFVGVFAQAQGMAMAGAGNRPASPTPTAASPAAESAHRVLLALSSLFKPREHVQRKYREVAPRRLEAFVLGEGPSESPTHSPDPDFCSEEVELIRTALRSGPGSLVADEIETAARRRRRREEHERIEASRRAESGSPADGGSQSQTQAIGLSQSQGAREGSSQSEREAKLKLRDEWLAAIERRELSLQILLILEALRLSSEYPAILSMNSAAATGPSADATPASHASVVPDSAAGPSRPAPTPLQPLDAQPKAPAESTEEVHTTASAPAAALPAQVAGNSASEDSASSKKKRKRKSTQARRWTGISSVLSLDGEDGADGVTFPWEKRPFKPGADDQEEDRDRDADDAIDTRALATDPERLHRRFESLVDRLSLRIVTADLAKDLDFTDGDDMLAGPSVAGSPSAADNLVTPGKKVSATAAAAQSFGTSARVREERDERDELHFLCSDIVEPRFSRMLPRQCALLRSRATGGGTGGLLGGNTPARPTRSAGLPPGSVERQRLAHARKEADLLSKKKAAEERARAREAQRASQRPALKDALVLEEKNRMGRGRSARASSITADAERNKREVSVSNRVRTGLARSASTSSAVALASAEAERETASQAAAASAFTRSASSQAPFPLPAPSLRPSKRKTLEPQRFAGRLTTVTTNKHASSSQPAALTRGASQGEDEDPDEDNPFRASSAGADDSADSSMSWLNAGRAAASAGRTRPSQAAPAHTPFSQPTSSASSTAVNSNRTLWGAGRRTFSRTQTHAQPSTQSQGSAPVVRRTFVDDRGAAIPDDPRAVKAAGTWQRTESQPVTRRDISDLSGQKRASSGGDAADDGHESSGLSEEDSEGEGDEEEEEEPTREEDEEEEEMLISRRNLAPRAGQFLRIGSMGLGMGLGLGRGSRISTPTSNPVPAPASPLDKAMAPQAQAQTAQAQTAQAQARPLPNAGPAPAPGRPIAVPSGRNPFAKVSRG